MKLRILCVTSSDALRQRFARLSDTHNTVVDAAAPAPDVWSGLARESFDLLISTLDDLPLPLPDFVLGLKALPGRPDLVILTQDPDPEAQARVLAAGGLAAVYTRLPDPLVRSTLTALFRRIRRTQEAEKIEDDTEIEPDLADFVADSPPMKRLLAMAERVATADTALLILGETGVGKEWLARSIHQRSARARGPFIAVNCAALPEGLFESELFGHVEGAFTGAAGTRRGYFELAHGGTLFLDEIGELPRALQAKLLRVLQEDEIRPVGAEDPIALDARIIVATNRDLEQAIERKEFRRDLFYRISVVSLSVPPLRERKEDIETLVMNYLERFAIELKRPAESLHPDAMRALLAYPWPGNVRELINVMERSVLLSRNRQLALADLPRSVVEGAAARPGAPALGETGLEFQEAWLDEPLAEVREHVTSRIERRYLKGILRRSGGRVGEAARRAAISPRTLFNKMRTYGLRKEDYKY